MCQEPIDNVVTVTPVSADVIWWECGRKVRYATFEEAARVKQTMTKKTHKSVRFTILVCKYCEGFHLGRDREVKVRVDRRARNGVRDLL